MHIGMMWFDNDPRTTLAAKIQKASRYYQQKFGRLPDLCLVPPEALDAAQADLTSEQSITVRAYRPVLPGHLWIGTEEQNS